MNNQYIKVTQVKSELGRQKSQIGTMIGLGLRKIGQERVLEDTTSVRGMVNKVKHLIKVEQI